MIKLTGYWRLAVAALSQNFFLLGSRLAIDFANMPSYPGTPAHELSWEQLLLFLEGSGIVSSERAASLLALASTDPETAEALLTRSVRLRNGLRKSFAAIVKKEQIAREWLEPINEILRITEGHDELVPHEGTWKLEFLAREGGLDWLLAAVARSAAEIVVEGAQARIRSCANPGCGLFFCDSSRTRRRRWCSMAICGNRHKVASFAKRHAS
jgi:predicted RNA-binding Zn ribbon-like protein